MNSTSGVDQILGQIKALRQQTPGIAGAPGSAPVSPPDAPGAVKPAGFGDLFTQALNAANETSARSGDLKQAYLRGDDTVSLAQVMIASQKSDISFRSVVEVRNKMIDAYREVMRMSV